MGCVKLNSKPPLLFIYLMGCVKLNFKHLSFYIFNGMC